MKNLLKNNKKINKTVSIEKIKIPLNSLTTTLLIPITFPGKYSKFSAISFQRVRAISDPPGPDLSTKKTSRLFNSC